MALLQFWRDNIKSSYDDFYESLDLNPFLDELVAHKAITETQSLQIKQQMNHKEQVSYLLYIIDIGPDKSLETFVEVLRKTNIPLAIRITGGGKIMKQANIESLEIHRQTLIEMLNLDQLLEDLESKQAISKQDRQLIAATVEPRQTAELLDILKTKPDQVYYMFKDSLQATGQQNLLTDCLSDPPVLRLNVRQNNKQLESLDSMLPLVDGGLVVVNHIANNHDQVLLLDDEGNTVRMLYEERTDNGITGLVERDGDLLLLHRDRTIRLINIESGTEKKRYEVQADCLLDGIRFYEESLLLVDEQAGRIIEYSLANGRSNILVKELYHPTSIDECRFETYTGLQYLVCEPLNHNVIGYKWNWQKVLTVGGPDVEDCQFWYPYSAIFLPDYNFLVADHVNSIVTEFTIEGKFIRNLNLGDIKYPYKLIYQNKHLWLNELGNVRKYQLSNLKTYMLSFWRRNLGRLSIFEQLEQKLDLHSFLEEMVAEKAITDNQLSQIKQQKTYINQMCYLISTILRSSNQSLEAFVEVVRATNTSHALQMTGGTKHMINELDQHRPTLIENLNLDLVVEQLQITPIISKHERQLTEATEKCRQTAELLDILKTKPEYIYQTFEDILLETGQKDLLFGRLVEPVLILDVKQASKQLGSLYNMLPLEQGGVVVANHVADNHDQVLWLDDKGFTVRMLIENKPSFLSKLFLGKQEENRITGFIQKHLDLFVLYRNGTFRSINIKTGTEQRQYKVQAEGLCDGILVDGEILVLVDCDAGRIIGYRLYDGRTKILLKGLNAPISIDSFYSHKGRRFIVLLRDCSKVHIYNEKWRRVGCCTLDSDTCGMPGSAVCLLDSNFLVTDWNNKRVSEFNLKGEFIRHLKLGDIENPCKLKFVNEYTKKYLWILEGSYPHQNVKKYQIYQ